MTDYIKRADALKVFETDSMIKAWHATEHIPSADVVPVVRCKDCVWYVRSIIKQDGTIDERYKPDWCDLYRRVREETYFCADGEREDDE